MFLPNFLLNIYLIKNVEKQMLFSILLLIFTLQNILLKAFAEFFIHKIYYKKFLCDKIVKQIINHWFYYSLFYHFSAVFIHIKFAVHFYF